jgi:hypothetical protein
MITFLLGMMAGATFAVVILALLAVINEEG